MSKKVQKEYIAYIEKTIGTFYAHEVPNIDKIKAFIKNGADINSVFLDNELATNFMEGDGGSTLLYSLIRKANKFNGKKYDAVIKLIQYILELPQIDPNIGLYKINRRTKEVEYLRDRPLLYAVNNRMPNVIRLLLAKDTIDVPSSAIEKWMSYLQEARSVSETEKLREIMRLLDPDYKIFDEIPGRFVPYNAINIYSQEDIQDGNIMVNLNKEYYGDPGVVGSHSHFYRKDGWNMAKKKHSEYQEELLYEWAMEPTPIKSPMTRVPIETVNVYRAEKEPHPVEQNFRAIQTNLFQGGKKSMTRKLKRKSRAKTAKWTQ
jgi:hypothetical protein